MPMRAIVDKAACCGYGVCAEICPEIFKLDDQGIAYVEASSISAELEDAAKEACEACPQSAISIEEIA